MEEPSDKHKKGGWGTEMDLDDATAQEVLANSVQGGKQQYGFRNGKLYEFQHDNAGGFHGYPIPGNEALIDVLRDMRKSGTITKSQFEKLRKGKM